MKNILLTLFCVMIALSTTAQENTENDSTKHVKVISDRDTIEMKVGSDKKQSSSTHRVKHPNLFAGITFSRFDLGLAKMLDHGKGTLSSENDFLNYRSWKSINVGFDVAQIGYKFDDQFRILLSAGFDWTHFRLKNDIIIKEDTSPLDYEISNINYSKNRFSSSYLRIPLTFEVRSKDGTFPHRLKFAAGPITGILIQGSQKFKSREEGKKKNIDDFNYTSFRYGAFARVGYNSFGLYAKYYFNDMFQNSPDQVDLKNLSFGMTFFF